MGQKVSACFGRTLIINELKTCNNPDCDPDLKPSVAAELEKQVDRLEKLVERLERSVSAHQLEIANRVFNSVVDTQKRRSFDIETAELPPIPNTSTDTSLNKIIDRLENNINKINYIKDENNKNNLNNNNSNNINNNIEDGDGSLENIPTVLDEYLIEEGIIDLNHQQQEDKQFIDIKENNIMSVNGYEDIILGPLTQYINVSNKIGGDVAKHAALVGKAFDAQFAYIKLTSQNAQPPQNKQMELLKPTSDQIAAIQDFREKNRTSQYFNHLSAISESIPALGWVCVSPTPGPHVKEMNDAGQFYTNRVLKDWKDKDPTHVEWARSWIQTLTELQKYIKQYHTTGLVWSGKGQIAAGGVPPPPPGCPPPPPPPVLDMSSMSLGGADDRSALFAEINRGEDITKGLRKVTADMQTHKNPTLRTGPAPFKAPTPTSTTPSVQPTGPVTKAPVFQKDGKKWIIEHQKSNPSLNIDNAEMNNVIYMFKCENSTLTIKGKVNSVFMDSCKKCSLLVDSVVASIEFVNCQSVQMQVLQKCPTISIDKTDGCQMYLSKESLDVEIVSSKSSEMNVMIPKGNGDYVEQPIPEQYKTLIKGTSLQTTCVESLG
ncbi:adenylyl cyclase-associated protein 1 [Condylostylus longicornis]|uniref:adenylyl cyclase-associated protein 1 n=1 Tax=Condylostylus longicornis TaxID=2530218 RepID=UPI00244E0422|nr:adenylyl cyclase-associated protein 1 [Condylostylus longicornis]